MSNVDQRFALLDQHSGDELYPYMKLQKSTNRFGFALTRPGEQDRKGGGHYTTDLTEVVRRVVIDGWNVRVKTIDRVGKQREGSLGIGKIANAGYWVAPEFLDLVKGSPTRPLSALPSKQKGQRKVDSGPPTNKPSSNILEPSRQGPVASPKDQAALESDTASLKTAEREAVVNVRYGQGSFREALFKEDGERCWMSGIEGKRLLIASHIRPWSHCKDDIELRGQPNNGLLLSALWDTAFDAGLVSFDPNWKVVTSDELAESAKRALALNETTSLPEKFRNERRRKYLAYHRAKIFEKWKNINSREQDNL